MYLRATYAERLCRESLPFILGTAYKPFLYATANSRDAQDAEASCSYADVPEGPRTQQVCCWIIHRQFWHGAVHAEPSPLTLIQTPSPIYASNPAFIAAPTPVTAPRAQPNASVGVKSNPLHKPGPELSSTPFLSNPLHVQGDSHSVKPLPVLPQKPKVQPPAFIVAYSHVKDTPPKKATEKKKDADRPLSPREASEISGPMNVQHKVHVNKDFQWTGDDIFDLSEKLGEGCVLHREDYSYFLLELEINTCLVPTAQYTKLYRPAPMQCWPLRRLLTLRTMIPSNPRSIS